MLRFHQDRVRENFENRLHGRIGQQPRNLSVLYRLFLRMKRWLVVAKLLELDDRPEDTSLLNDIFRPFHTVKGNASALGIVSVERVAHKVENLLEIVGSKRALLGTAYWVPSA